MRVTIISVDWSMGGNGANYVIDAQNEAVRSSKQVREFDTVIRWSGGERGTGSDRA